MHDIHERQKDSSGLRGLKLNRSGLKQKQRHFLNILLQAKLFFVKFENDIEYGTEKRPGGMN